MVFSKNNVECSRIIDPIIFHDASSFFDLSARPLLTSHKWRTQQFIPTVFYIIINTVKKRTECCYNLHCQILPQGANLPIW